MALMPLQLAIIRLVAQGNSNKEVAVKLGISTMMVKNRLYTIQRRLKSRNRAHMVGTAIRLGYVPADVAVEGGELDDGGEGICGVGRDADRQEL
jgi:DNA-binding CsgD family transcriptional regulator